jgi:hypothetical protein
MKEIGTWIANDRFYVGGKILLRLKGVIVLDTDGDLSPDQVAAQIGQALGITFGKDVEGIYEETYALTAVVMNHSFAVYREEKDSVRPYAGRVVLEVREWAYKWRLGFREGEYVLLIVNIAEHLAALLREKTGLPFVAHRPVEGEL